MKQNISNSEEIRTQYLYEVQQVARQLKETYSDRYESLMKDMFNLNIRINRLSEILKLHRQDATLLKFKQKHAKLS